jgi:hypothetical protein
VPAARKFVADTSVAGYRAMNTDLRRYWPILVVLLYLMVFGLCTYYRIEVGDFLVSLLPL